MAYDYKSCNPAALIAAASCFSTCWQEEELLAVELYIRAKDLAINGGPDYTGVAGIAKLVQDAKGWSNQVFDKSKRQAVALYIDLQNAIESASETRSHLARSCCAQGKCSDNLQDACVWQN